MAGSATGIPLPLSASELHEQITLTRTLMPPPQPTSTPHIHMSPSRDNTSMLIDSVQQSQLTYALNVPEVHRWSGTSAAQASPPDPFLPNPLQQSSFEVHMLRQELADHDLRACEQILNATATNSH